MRVKASSRIGSRYGQLTLISVGKTGRRISARFSCDYGHITQRVVQRLSEKSRCRLCPNVRPFWSLVDTSAGPSACWPWLGRTKSRAYGCYHMNGRKYQAHRVAWAILHGPIPDGMCVCHSCDNPPCCNPAHLWLGSNLDNIRDKVQKGRSPRNCIGGAKLSEADVREIRRAKREGARAADLARRFCVAKNTIRAVLTGKCWSRVQ